MHDRQPCCLDADQPCGTRWTDLAAWVTRVTGKGFRMVQLSGDEQGRSPFFAQPVGFDGRTFFIAHDGLCDTEKLLHEACHFLTAPRERRHQVNYGLGPGPFRPVDDLVSDNEELAASLLQLKLAPHFGLGPDKMPRPDYNVANRRHLDWDAAETRANEVFGRLENTLPPLSAATPGQKHSISRGRAGARFRSPRGGALIVALGLAGSAFSPRESLAQVASSEAQSHFDRGRQLFGARRWDDALREFTAAHTMQPSPNSLLYIGLCERNVGRHIDAYRDLARAADMAEARAPNEPRYARTADLARREAAGVSQHVARLFVRVTDGPPGLVVRVNGRTLDTSEWNGEVPVAPGEVTVDAEAPGRPPFRRASTLAAGAQADVDVRLATTDAPRPDLSAVGRTPSASAGNEGFSNVRSTRSSSGGGGPTSSPVDSAGDGRGASPLLITSGVLLGLGGAMLILGATTGGLALSAHGSLTTDCLPSPTPACQDVTSRVASGRTFVTLANVGFISGGLSAGLGVTLLVVGLVSDSRGGGLGLLPTFASVRPHVDPWLGTLGVRGTF